MIVLGFGKNIEIEGSSGAADNPYHWKWEKDKDID